MYFYVKSFGIVTYNYYFIYKIRNETITEVYQQVYSQHMIVLEG